MPVFFQFVAFLVSTLRWENKLIFFFLFTVELHRSKGKSNTSSRKSNTEFSSSVLDYIIKNKYFICSKSASFQTNNIYSGQCQRCNLDWSSQYFFWLPFIKKTILVFGSFFELIYIFKLLVFTGLPFDPKCSMLFQFFVNNFLTFREQLGSSNSTWKLWSSFQLIFIKIMEILTKENSCLKCCLQLW